MDRGMLMADHEMKTTAPDTGLRIRTEVKVPGPAAASEAAATALSISSRVIP